MSRHHVRNLPPYDPDKGKDLDWEGVREMAIKHLLVIDDEAKIRDTYKRILSKQGIEVLTASNAADANNLLVQEDIDIALLDINMAELGGPILFDVIRAFHRNVKVVVSSVYPIDEQMDLIQNADAYFDKSDGLDALLRIVSSLLATQAPPHEWGPLEGLPPEK